MSLPVVFRAEAYLDMDVAHATYERHRVGLGDEFAAEVRDLRDRIGEQPYLYAVLEDDVRAVQVHRFPYVVYYTVEPERVVIFAVLHAHRSARAWQRRR